MGLKHLFITLAAAEIFRLTKATLTAPNALTLQITKNTTHAIPSTLYGYMWEDINHSGDGGLYGELLQNRAFQAVVPGTLNALNSWQPFNGPRISVTNKTPGVSASLPNSLQVGSGASLLEVYSNAYHNSITFLGIKVQKGWTYTGSFYAKSDTFDGSVTASLKSVQGTIYASATVKGVSKSWKKFTFTFTPTESAPDEKNVFNLAVDGAQAAGKTVFFGMLSLFPPTFRGRENGMRIDLAEALASTQPSVWRFPGGNNIEAYSRWKWNETIGRLEDRPGRVANWGYPNTDGLGLMEYLNWAEDLGAEPILGVWSGIAVANYSDLGTWTVVPQQDLQPFVDDVLNEIEFVIGDAKTTKFGKMRASLGREEPYALRFVEIGNEDSFQPDSYSGYRWNSFVTAINAKFPQLECLATTLPSTTLTPAYTKIDFHQYNSPPWFETGAFMFDDYPRNGTQWFVVTSTNDSNALPDIPGGRLAYPTLQGSTAEAAFMTGMERNSDVVFASAYAPSLQHIRSFSWTPDIITYDAVNMVKSTSYYVQQMFSVNRGTHVLSTNPVSSQDSAPLYWVASVHNETNVIFLKVANTGTADLVANIFFDFNTTSVVTATQLSSPALTPISGIFNISNTLDEPEQIIPALTSTAIPFPDRMNFTFPAMSVTVVTMESPDFFSEK
ncbi:hypothetical protein D9619_002697 [Psilocybe cf. subviscida]|uniref:non-reducing end alpha-L-arabinofuranosidase n=1 Tax=Psilocybe cf. subviscida TaxID=2480587 RepID=A0A8H5AXB6_9AGAR|nr:hypothetical protein D9619_002697 [Psilocybe cf. subviscida]